MSLKPRIQPRADRATHGGGVLIREVCLYCGKYRVTDTWAQDRCTGEQGLRSTRYEDADEVSASWIGEHQQESRG